MITEAPALQHDSEISWAEVPDPMTMTFLAL
jgi:hypothetical protein